MRLRNAFFFSYILVAIFGRGARFAFFGGLALLMLIGAVAGKNHHPTYVGYSAGRHQVATSQRGAL